MSNTFTTLTPAYGRDYKSASDAQTDFNAGLDFIFHDVTSPYDGKPCSIRDFPDGTDIKIRFNSMRSLVVFKMVLPSEKV